MLVGDEVVGDLPVTALVDECPAYDLAPAPPTVPLYDAPPRMIEDDLGAAETLLALLGSANVASRRPVFEQYDSIVGSRTARRPEQADAAVLMLATDGDRRPALAVSIDGNGRRVAVDPYRGAVEAVLECSANLACVGAEPLGLTNCLNFGNPEKPHIAWQLTRAVAGLADACRALGVPGRRRQRLALQRGRRRPDLPDAGRRHGRRAARRRAGGRRSASSQPGDAIALITARGWAPSLVGSELGKLRGQAPEGELPVADLGELRTLHAAIRQAVRSGALRSAHDVAEGGVAVALAECCVASGHGAEVTVEGAEAALFGEGPGAFVVSGRHDAFAAFGEAATVIGVVGGDELRIGDALAVRVDALAGVHADGLAELMR